MVQNMNNIDAVIHAQGLMFIYIGIGFLCRKLNITDDHVENKLTAALMNIVFPCMIFTAMVNILGSTKLSDVLVAIIICIGLVLFSYGVGFLLYRKAPREKRAVLIYSVLSSNAGFVGIPILAAIYGDTGVLYAAIYMAVIRFFTWTVGLKLYVHGEQHALRRIIVNPNNIAMVLAVVFQCLNIRLPGIMIEVMEEVGGISTLFCMVIVGSIVSSSFRFKRMLTPVAYWYSALRLVAIPLLTQFILTWLGIDPTITGSMVILVAAPAPIMACVFAARYDADKELAVLLVLVSTMLSLVTQPALIYLCNI